MRNYTTNPTKIRRAGKDYGQSRLTRWAGKRGSRWDARAKRWAHTAMRYGRVDLSKGNS